VSGSALDSPTPFGLAGWHEWVLCLMESKSFGEDGVVASIDQRQQ
jgi:hypothetical protein